MTYQDKLSNCLLLLIASTVAVAAPPPGHPSPDTAMQIMGHSSLGNETHLPHRGKILTRIDANEYSYLEVDTGNGSVWLAAPRGDFKLESTIRFSDGVVMRNFYSKLLRRTFAAVSFVARVEIIE